MIAAGLQQAMDFWLADAPDARVRCAALAGRTVMVELTDIGARFYLQPHPDGIRVELEYEGAVDATLRARSLELLRLSRAEGSAGAAGRVQVEGDAEVARDMRALLRAVPFDPEERVARLLGDVPAHQLGRLLRGIAAISRDTLTTLGEMSAEYLHYESRQLPTRDEVAAFVAQVDAMRDDVDRAAARLGQIARESSQ